MAKYVIQDNGIILEVATGKYIPEDPHNADYAAYLLWEKGATGGSLNAAVMEQSNLESIKKDKIEDLKELAKVLIGETDWYIIRSIESTKNVPVEVTNRRKAIRSYVSLAEKEIIALKHANDVKSYIFKFPKR